MKNSALLYGIGLLAFLAYQRANAAAPDRGYNRNPNLPLAGFRDMRALRGLGALRRVITVNSPLVANVEISRQSDNGSWAADYRRGV